MRCWETTARQARRTHNRGRAAGLRPGSGGRPPFLPSACRAKPVAGKEELSAGVKLQVRTMFHGFAARVRVWPSTLTAPAVCVARTTLQPLLGRTVQFDSKTSVASGKRTAICSAEAASVTPSLPARRPSTCAMVWWLSSAAAMLEAVAVSWSAAERFAASAEVIWLFGLGAAAEARVP